MGWAMYVANAGGFPVPVTETWDWQLRGACRDLDSSVFFHPDQERGSTRANREARAKRICRSCPVVEQCRRYALSVREPYGVWGGLSADERNSLLRGCRRTPRGAPPEERACSGGAVVTPIRPAVRGPGGAGDGPAAGR